MGKDRAGSPLRAERVDLQKTARSRDAPPVGSAVARCPAATHHWPADGWHTRIFRLPDTHRAPGRQTESPSGNPTITSGNVIFPVGMVAIPAGNMTIPVGKTSQRIGKIIFPTAFQVIPPDISTALIETKVITMIISSWIWMTPSSFYMKLHNS